MVIRFPGARGHIASRCIVRTTFMHDAIVMLSRPLQSALYATCAVLLCPALLAGNFNLYPLIYIGIMTTTTPHSFKR